MAELEEKMEALNGKEMCNEAMGAFECAPEEL